jgi:hypothetical protein
MSRSKAISRWEVEQRRKENEADRELIQKLVDLAGVASRESKAEFKHKLTTTIEAYRARVLADQQERPARIMAALEPVLQSARDLLARLVSLPTGLRIELQAGGVEEQLEAMISKADDRLVYWRQHVAANRPTGEGAASLDLRRSLTDIFAAHCLDVPPEDRAKERKLRDFVAYACQEIGARFPDETKNRRRFTGDHSSHCRESLMAYVAHVIDEQLRNPEARVDERKRFSRLIDVPI